MAARALRYADEPTAAVTTGRVKASALGVLGEIEGWVRTARDWWSEPDEQPARATQIEMAMLLLPFRDHGRLRCTGQAWQQPPPSRWGVGRPG